MLQAKLSIDHRNRGHPQPYLLVYSDLKERVGALSALTSARADPRRRSLELQLIGKVTYDWIAKQLGSQQLGGEPISVSASWLIKHRKELAITATKIAKIDLPTEQEQPNGRYMNRFAKDILIWVVRNSQLVNGLEDDDHAMTRLDYLLRSVRSVGFDALHAVQQHEAERDDGVRRDDMTRRSVPMNTRDATHQDTAKAKAHDMITAAGYKAILKSRLCFNSALNADNSPWRPDEPRAINYDVSGDEVLDGHGHVTVRIHKTQPSTIYEHLRDSLAHFETRRSSYYIPGTEIIRPAFVKSTDGGADEHPTGIRQQLASAILVIATSATFLHTLLQGGRILAASQGGTA